MTLHLLDASEIQIQRISSFSIAIQREKGKMTGNNLMVIIIVGGGGHIVIVIIITINMFYGDFLHLLLVRFSEIVFALCNGNN